MRAQPILDDDGRKIGAYWTCYCGCLVEAFGYDVSCDECGRLYNGFGQELKPQSQWGENGDY